MRASLSLCAGGSLPPQHFLFQARPDLFPEGYLTPMEIGLWGRYAEWLKTLRSQR